MNLLLVEDMDWTVSNLPPSVIKRLKEDAGLVLAGGFIRACIAGEQPTDIDLFSPNYDAAKRSVDLLIEETGAKLFPTENAFSVVLPVERKQVQFIHKWTYETAESVLDSFDFTISGAAIWYRDGWWSVCLDRFYLDLAAKRLHYTGKGEPGGSMLRLVKFCRRGYRISPESIAGIVGRLAHSVVQQSEEEPDFQAAVLRELREIDPGDAAAIYEGDER